MLIAFVIAVFIMQVSNTSCIKKIIFKAYTNNTRARRRRRREGGDVFVQVVIIICSGNSRFFPFDKAIFTLHVNVVSQYIGILFVSGFSTN